MENIEIKFDQEFLSKNWYKGSLSEILYKLDILIQDTASKRTFLTVFSNTNSACTNVCKAFLKARQYTQIQRTSGMDT
ncbi:hypothetical protein FRC07_007472 [Ceratobasidium sp. 392]|nr:hypothetical protein FRC07_007472 [Ceratobasidium sp. 392]